MTPRLSTAAGTPTILPFTSDTARSDGQKSSQPNSGAFTVAVRSYTLGFLARCGIQVPYMYAMSGALPPASTAWTFCSMSSTFVVPTAGVIFTSGWALL
nr:hypothetical protein [Nonomuraea diastatica]